MSGLGGWLDVYDALALTPKKSKIPKLEAQTKRKEKSMENLDSVVEEAQWKRKVDMLGRCAGDREDWGQMGIRFRFHRGGLAESMETVGTFASVDDVKRHIAQDLAHFIDVAPDAIHARRYSKDGDPRIGWQDLFIITIDGYGAIGFADSWDE